MSDKSNIRVFAIGSCDGFPEILRALESNDEVELVGARETVAEAASALSGGHLEAVLLAARGSELPAASAFEHLPVALLIADAQNLA